MKIKSGFKTKLFPLNLLSSSFLNFFHILGSVTEGNKHLLLLLPKWSSYVSRCLHIASDFNRFIWILFYLCWYYLLRYSSCVIIYTFSVDLFPIFTYWLYNSKVFFFLNSYSAHHMNASVCKQVTKRHCKQVLILLHIKHAIKIGLCMEFCNLWKYFGKIKSKSLI